MYFFLILWLVILILLAICLIVYAAVLVMLAVPYRLPFVRLGDEHTKGVVRMLGDLSGRKVVDLGSGDGKIVIALALAGAEAHGHEINPALALWSRFRIRRVGLSNRAYIHRSDFWKEDMGQYDAITLFGIRGIMPELEKKMIGEMRSGSRIVTVRCEFPNWQPTTVENKVFLYMKE